MSLIWDETSHFKNDYSPKLVIKLQISFLLIVSSADYPDLRKHNNCMASALTPSIYSRLRDRATPNNWTLDQCIQTGVDNPGHPFIKTVGMVAGDEESYEVGIYILSLLWFCFQLSKCMILYLISQVFAELFDPVIKERHNGYDPRTMKHPTDLDASKVYLWGFITLHTFPHSGRVWRFLLPRSPREFLTSATCCHLVCVPVAASVGWVCLPRARGLSAARWRTWLWWLSRAWRETWLVDTTAWERWLRGSSSISLMSARTNTHLQFCYSLDNISCQIFPSVFVTFFNRSTSCLINRCHLCSQQLGWPETGLMLVESGKKRTD